MKKIAMLVLCHTMPEQVNEFVARFDSKHFDFYIHVDRKSDIAGEIKERENVTIIPADKRVSVIWAGYGMVEATLILIRTAMDKGDYDYYWLCSGQDFPIKDCEHILKNFEDSDNNYINIIPSEPYDKRWQITYPSWIIGKKTSQRIIKRLWVAITGGRRHTFGLFYRTPPGGIVPYHGSSWWCLNRETIKWITDYLDDHSEVCRFFAGALCPDESIFQTLVMMCPAKGTLKDYLVYVDWSEGKSSPKILTNDDYNKLAASDMLLCRKIDSVRSPELYRRLLREIKPYE